MKKSRATGMAQSVLERLKTEAVESARPFAELLVLYGVERFLHRLGRSEYRSRFVLKGALLLRHWIGVDARPTRDIDLLGPTDFNAEHLREILGNILRVEVEDDGIEFIPESISVSPIRPESVVAGIRAKFHGYLGRTLLHYQVDVGQGDAVYPPTDEVLAGGLLGLPAASVRAYTPYTSVAEKLEAMVVLGEANSRMKDFYDLAVLAHRLEFDGTTLAESIRQTFQRRSTLVPEGGPEGLRESFSQDSRNAARWQAFLRKGRLKETRADFSSVIDDIRPFVLPVLDAVRKNADFPRHWPAGGPWGEKKGSE